jgi:hypothetical protein
MQSKLQVAVAEGKLGETKSFQFDVILGEDSTQTQVYGLAAQPIVAEMLSGYNASIFCYGMGVFHTILIFSMKYFHHHQDPHVAYFLSFFILFSCVQVKPRRAKRIHYVANSQRVNNN